MNAIVNAIVNASALVWAACVWVGGLHAVPMLVGVAKATNKQDFTISDGLPKVSLNLAGRARGRESESEGRGRWR